MMSLKRVQICGQNKPTHEGIKMLNSHEGTKMYYVTHYMDDNHLAIIQQTNLVRVTTVYNAYGDTNAIRVHTEVENISKEGVAFFKSLTDMKKQADPYLPHGFTRYGEPRVASGLKTGKTIALAVWNLGEDVTDHDICINEGIASVKMGYPSAPNAKFSHDRTTLHVEFDEPKSAAFFLIETK